MLQQTPVARVVPAYEAWLERWPTVDGARGGRAGRGGPRVGAPGLPAPGAAPARGRLRRGASGTAGSCRRPCPSCSRCRASATTPPGRSRRSPSASGARWSTRTCAGWWPGSCRAWPTPPPPGATSPLVDALLPDDPEAAATASIAFMELGALVCTARAPRCPACPLVDRCAWVLAGRPALDAPVQRPQGYAGTDRQVRGRLLGVLRDADGPVPADLLAAGVGRAGAARPGARRPGRRRPRRPAARRPVRPADPAAAGTGG